MTEIDNNCLRCAHRKACMHRPSVLEFRDPKTGRIARSRDVEIARLLFTPSELLTDEDNSRLPVGVADVLFMLNRKGESHRDGYFMYTTVNAMRGIFSNRKLHLTRASEMNDQVECSCSDKMRWNKMFIACFSQGQGENMGMWSMYGGAPEESVRLCFSKKGMIKQLSDWRAALGMHLFLAEQQPNDKFSYRSIKSVDATIALHDVLYQHRRSESYGSVHWNGKFAGQGRSVVFRDARKCPPLTGYVKDAAWEYERETRLVLEFHGDVPKEWRTLALDADLLLANVSVLLGPHDSKETRVRTIIASSGLNVDVAPSALKVKFRSPTNN